MRDRQATSWRDGRLLLLLTVCHLCITVPLAYCLSLWVDEAYTLRTTARGAAHALQQAIEFELQPPAYYVLLSVWRGVDPGLFVARLASVLCAALAIPATAMASRRLFPRLSPAWVAVALGFNPWVVFAAVEARPYAMSLLITSALLLLFQRGFLEDEPRIHHQLVFACVGLLALHTQYYLGFLLAAAGVALLALRRWRDLRSYVLWMLPVGLGFLPLLVSVPGQVTSHSGFGVAATLNEALRHTMTCFEDLVMANGTAPFERAGRWLNRTILTVTLLAAGWDVLRGRRRPGECMVALLSIAFVLVVTFVALVVALGPWILLTRHMMFSLPVVLLLLYGAVAEARRPWLAAIMTVLLLSSSTWRIYLDHAPLAKQGDHARVAQYLSESETAGQPILVFPGEQTLPLGHYYRGRNRLVPLPGSQFLVRYDPRDVAWASREHVVRSLQEGTGLSRECWLITYPADQVMGYPLHSDLLESVVSDRFRVVQRRTFWDGTLARLLWRSDESPEAGGALAPDR